MGVRVVRLIEYTYKNVEEAEWDMARWKHSHRNSNMTMRSASLPFEAIEWLEEEPDATG